MIYNVTNEVAKEEEVTNEMFLTSCSCVERAAAPPATTNIGLGTSY